MLPVKYYLIMLPEKYYLIMLPVKYYLKMLPVKYYLTMLSVKYYLTMFAAPPPTYLSEKLEYNLALHIYTSFSIVSSLWLFFELHIAEEVSKL